ncbi:MAG: hypothetical protein HKN87_09795 [Saprospiraceae bacterium]|nr:hypothetical protein [Saprospiraceae bacterium]
MKPSSANILTAIVLIVMSAWGYFGSETPSVTALIPAFFGIVFLALSGPFRKENKVVAHIIVVLTLLVFISLFKPLSGVLSRNDTLGIVRVGAMLVVSLIALVIYIKSFIAARKAKA